MPHYKDTFNKLYFIDFDDKVDLLPDGCTEITNAEADALRAPSAEKIKADRVIEIDTILSEIDKKRARAISDAVLTGDKQYAQALEDQAVPLRAERKTLTT